MMFKEWWNGLLAPPREYKAAEWGDAQKTLIKAVTVENEVAWVPTDSRNGDYQIIKEAVKQNQLTIHPYDANQ